jgi:hypothetical protein
MNMDNNTALSANKGGISRKKFFASSVAAAVTGGLMAAAKPLAAAGPETACLSMSFTGTLDDRGRTSFPHGLGGSLPANILSVSAFIRLPDGKVRNISVQHVDETSIAIAGGVANAFVKVGVVYTRGAASW